MASNQDAWPNAYFLDPGCMRSCSATRVVEASKAAGPILQYWRQVQADYGGFVVSLSTFYNEPGMETQLKYILCGRPRAGGCGGYPGPPISCTEYTPPLGAQENPQRVYVQDAETLTVDLIEAHSKRFSMASEGESWSLMGWSQDRFRALLADQTFAMSIDSINLAHVGLHALGAYESLAYGEAEAFRAAHPTPMDLPDFASVGRLGIGRFNRRMDATKAQLSSPRDGFGYDPCHGNPSTNGFGDTVTGYGCFSSCPCSKESRGQDRGQQGKGTFPRKVWACQICCPEDVGSPSSSEAYSVEANACCPGGIGCSSARCCCYSQYGYRKGFSSLAASWFVMVVRPP